jgi:hypothetical protein
MVYRHSEFKLKRAANGELSARDKVWIDIFPTAQPVTTAPNLQILAVWLLLI